MWFYLSTAATATIFAWDKISTTCKFLRHNGIEGCTHIAKQVIANGIGHHIIEMHHTHYIIHYPYGVTWYKAMIPRNRSPCRIDTIYDDSDNDITAEILTLMGPSHNFHGIPTTPKMLGYTSITFEYVAGDTRSFDHDEVISLA